LPLLLERVGVRRIKNKEKYFILIPSSQPSPEGRRSEASLNLMALALALGAAVAVGWLNLRLQIVFQP
ncbi:hypothetical protein, partial [Methylomicrobium sp. Wu6]|uniref:hypothetical protein n=1 Tax=Methylomicrobium sp. Wu6 TaxID=3107928 RepID=UPI002DD69B29